MWVCVRRADNNTYSTVRNLNPCRKTHELSLPAALSSTQGFFNPLLPTAVRAAYTHTNKQGDEWTWRLKPGFGFIFFFLSVPLCLAQCVWGCSATYSFMEERWGGNLTARAALFCQVCDQSLCVCLCVYVHLSVNVPWEFVCETERFWTTVAVEFTY